MGPSGSPSTAIGMSTSSFASSSEGVEGKSSQLAPGLQREISDVPELADGFQRREKRRSLTMPDESSLLSADQGDIDSQSSAGSLVKRGVSFKDQLREKIKDRLHDAQVALLEQDRHKHDTYAGLHLHRSGTTGLAAPSRGLTAPLLPSCSNGPSRPCSFDGSPAIDSVTSKTPVSHVTPLTHVTTVPIEVWARRRCNSDSPAHNPDLPGIRRMGTQRNARSILRLGSLNNVQQKLKAGAAYMGIDWYQIVERRHRFSWLFFVENLYYYCYAGYIIAIILLGGVVLRLLDNKLNLVKAVYTSAACVSQSGLALVDWARQTQGTYVASFVLIILGSSSLLHLVPVVLRLLSFRMQAKMTATLHKDWRRELNGGSLAVSPSSRRLSRSASAPCLENEHNEDSVFADMRWNKESRLDSVDSQSFFEPDKSSVAVTKMLPKMQQLEYRALRMVINIMLAYWTLSHLIGFCVFYFYFEFLSGDIQELFHKEGLSSHWHAMYLTVSAFQNNGLVITPNSVMDFNKSPILLGTIGALILLGNTALPVMIRLITWCLRCMSHPGSANHSTLGFLLDHPRRCFTHLFPEVHTLWLAIVVVTLTAVQTGVMYWQDAGGAAMEDFGGFMTFWNCQFMAISTRTAGMNSVNVAFLSQASTFLMVVMMYVASTPAVVIMRFSALGGAHGQELDITGRAEGIEEEMLEGGDNTLKFQARRYLTQDATYLAVIIFLICCLEKDSFTASSRHAAYLADGIYGSFTFFKVLFEVISAYGTCGLSLGYRGQAYSFSGDWCAGSQYLLVVVMVLGRLRGLPDSIDPSVRVAMSKTGSSVNLE